MDSNSHRASSFTAAHPAFAPSHEEIAAEALALWQRADRPFGRDDQIWFEAERRVRNRYGPAEDLVARVPVPARAGYLMAELNDRFCGPVRGATTSL